jgi:hypothetical protein
MFTALIQLALYSSNISEKWTEVAALSYNSRVLSTVNLSEEIPDIDFVPDPSRDTPLTN